MINKYKVILSVLMVIFNQSIYSQKNCVSDSTKFYFCDKKYTNNSMYSYDVIQQTISDLSSVTFEYGLSAAYSTRGGEIYQNRIFLDDVPVYSPYRFGLIWGRGMNFINSSIIQNAKFSNDNISAKYGNYLSSVVCMNTQELLPQSMMNIFISPFDAGISINESQIDSKLRYSISYSKSIINESANIFEKYSGYPKSYQFNNKVTFQINDKQNVGLFFHASNNKTNMLTFNEFDVKPYSSSSINLLIFNYSSKINKLEHDLKISYQSNHLDYMLGVSDVDSLFDYQSKSNIIFIKDEYQYYFSDYNNLILGFDYTYFKPEMKFNPIVYNLYFARTGLTDYLRFKTNHHTLGIYSEANLKLNNELSSTIGVRYGNSELIGKSHILPRINFGYKVSKKIRIMLNYGEYVQYPSGIGLFDYMVPVDVNDIQSRSIVENSKNLSISADLKISSLWSVNISKYFKDDYVYWVNGGFEGKPVYKSLKKIDGFDFGSKLYYSNKIGFTFAYSYLNANRNYGYWSRSTPVLLKHKHQLVMTCYINFLKSINISMNYRYGSGIYIKQEPVYFIGYHDGYSYNMSNNSHQKLPNQQRFDIRLQYIFKFDSFKGLIYCEMLNVLNDINIYDYAWKNDGSTEDGLNFIGNICSYQINNIGFLPIIGLNIQF